MQGSLTTKSKVIYTVRPKSQVFKRKIKKERCSTPQRWSRRIRSLPPIPFNVLVPHRKTHKKITITKREKVGVSKETEKSNHKKSSFKLMKERKNNVFINKNVQNESDAVEVVRIVPVVVYVKNSTKSNLRSLPEDVQLQISGKLLNQAFDTFLGGKIKKEPLEKRYSRRIRMLPPCSVDVTTTKKK